MLSRIMPNRSIAPRGCLAKAFKAIAVVALLAVIGCGLFMAYLLITRNTALALPAPTGAYAVGRRQYDWVDPKRADPLADQANTKREFTAWVWYPAKAQPASTPAPYLPPAWSNARDADLGVGSLLEYNLASIRTHSFADVPLADAQSPFPVLIMEPGMGPVPTDYTVMAEDLASHGYVVVGINPTYTPFIVEFPDGRVVPRSAKGSIPDDASPAAADQDGNAIMQVWADDVGFVMDQLEGMNADTASPFHGRLDLANLGVFGHSFGGATAFYVCQRDPRCKAGANMDGDPFSIELGGTVQQPFMVMTEDYSRGCDSSCAALKQMAAHVKAGAAYTLMVSGAQHFNFSDLPQRQVPPVRPLLKAAGIVGSIDPLRGEQIASAYLVAFFNRYLRGIESPLLSGPSPDYPEVQINKR
jgi:predicted dienelactone hydrolase